MILFLPQLGEYNYKAATLILHVILYFLFYYWYAESDYWTEKLLKVLC